jgi:hypothetical protein
VKLVGLMRRHVFLTAVVVLVLAALIFFAVTVGLFGVGEEVPGDRADVFP